MQPRLRRWIVGEDRGLVQRLHELLCGGVAHPSAELWPGEYVLRFGE